MTLNINANKYYTKTDNNGYYTYNYKTNKVGTNTLTISYPGNTRYTGTTATKTFTVTNMPTKMSLDTIYNTEYGNYIPISGRYTDNNGNPLRYTNVILNINGVKTKTQTDNYGYYHYSYKVNKAGTNTVTVSYPGNTNYQGASATTTFTVYNVPTVITIESITNTYYDEYAYITGKYTDINNNPLRYTSLKLNINGYDYGTVKTDANGKFEISYLTYEINTNTVRLSYSGNNIYKSASATKSFTVTLKTYTMEMTIYPSYIAEYSEEMVGNDPFYSFYVTRDAQYDKGVYVELDERGLSEPATHKILKATFYFENNYNGNIITRTVNAQWDTFVQTSLISGYTPYKAIVYYRKLTPDEIDYW